MLKTKRTIIDILLENEAALLHKYYIENQAHLAPWEPVRDENFYSFENVQNNVNSARIAYQEGREYKFVALSLDRSEVIGVCNFTGVCRGPFQACFLGYSIAKKYEGQGYMREILESAIEFMFNTVGLNRIMANYIPDNERSGRLLKSLGFEREGYARKYLKIAGRWQDHILTSKINE